MSYVLINPGTGSVGNATIERAKENAERLARECGEDVTAELWKGEGDEEDGRWRFVLKRGERKTIVDMPGCSFEELSFFTRMYVDGDSWIWEFGVKRTREKLHG